MNVRHGRRGNRRRSLNHWGSHVSRAIMVVAGVVFFWNTAHQTTPSISRLSPVDQQRLDVSQSRDDNQESSLALSEEEENPSTLDNDASDDDSEQFVKVFIGIKTGESATHGVRLPQIQKTWLPDALDSGRINIKFFSNPPSAGIQSYTESATIEDASSTIDLEPLMVPSVACTRNTDLLCKTSFMFEYFLETDETSDFFCNFDDDNYVIVNNLLQVLTDYHMAGIRDLYVGRRGMWNGFRWNETTPRVFFGTGGAGYCLSRQVVERGREHFISLPTKLPDDVAVGYAAQEMAGARLVENKLFHSHLENQIWQFIPIENISKQVSFGYSNKREHERAVVSFPKVPIIFSEEEDPLLFRSLRCFLLREKSRDAALREQCPP